MTSSPVGRSGNAAGGWGLVALVVIVVVIGKCASSGGGSPATETSSLMESNITAGVAAQAPPAVKPLDASSVRRGAAHFRLAYRAEGLSGAMIYSQNCYDALTHKFGWGKLDSCGAFDLQAVRAIEEAEPADVDQELTYFQSETAAGRYLAAATGGGEDAAEADQRLSDLQSRTAKAPLPVSKPEPANANEPDEDAGDGASIISPQTVENMIQTANKEDTEL